MKKLTFLLPLLVLFSLITTPVNAAGSANYNFCNFFPSSNPTQNTGNVVLNKNCVVYEDVNGVADGDLTVPVNVAVTLHKKLVFYPSHKINVEQTGSGDTAQRGIIYINTGGSLVQSKICVKDADSDLYADTISISTDPRGVALSNPITQINQKPADPTTGLCEDETWNYRESMHSLTVADKDPNTNTVNKVATTDRELLRLGFIVAGVKDTNAAAGDLQVIDKNLLLCNNGECPTTTYTSPTQGNLYVAGKVGVGKTNPGFALDVAGTVNATALYVGGSPYIGSQWTTSGNNIYYTAGRIGVGLTNPAYDIDTRGTFAFGSAGQRTEERADAGLQGNAGAQSGFFQTASPTNYYTGASSWQHLIDVRHNNTANNYALQIAGSFFDQDLYFRKTNGSPTTAWNKFIYQNSAGNVGIGITNPTYKLQVSGTVYMSGSSRDYKQNIKPLEIDPKKIYQLNPISYDYKPEYKDLGFNLADGRQIGLIAEEVAQIYPELAIVTDRDGVKNKVSNVDYEKLSVILLAEMQNQKKEIDSLKQEVTNLQQRMQKIESAQK